MEHLYIVAIFVLMIFGALKYFKSPQQKPLVLSRAQKQLEDVGSEAKEKLITSKNFRNWQNPQSRQNIRVFQYNVLASFYCDQDRYDHCPRFALHWDYRGRNIVSEITQQDPDIICLQVI
jgi:mRNA deadenylase 3'-5' endonuclease subunit Ccr4